MRAICACCSVAALLLTGAVAHAGDWTRFRGPDGSGVSPDNSPTPVSWSETENLKWSLQLPGPGLSSPIIYGDKVFVTCWTGYEAGGDSSDDINDLKRCVVCVDRTSGEVLWNEAVDAVQPEERYQGMFAENGYASHTPVTDGQRVYAFLGKSGVVAFDMEGNRLWQTSVGAGEGMNGWGTASSPILYKDTVIVTAAAESNAIVALSESPPAEPEASVVNRSKRTVWLVSSSVIQNKRFWSPFRSCSS
ncbi:MAG: PQQ-binding-like beta-propeller repeat protein [Planctomycetales bacterium]|nr:PQQ-binding-like beta-propeller repeat protein [Planctomycetales bacterium]